MLSIVPYQKHYADDVSRLFHLAIQNISDLDYPLSQRQAWSAAPRSRYYWHKRLSKTQAWLMLDEDRVENGRPFCCGFINVETSFATRGYIDSLYVHPEYQRRGVGCSLFECLLAWAISASFTDLTVDASILSKPLFLSQGFNVKHRSYQEKSGQVIMGFLMAKRLFDELD